MAELRLADYSSLHVSGSPPSLPSSLSPSLSLPPTRTRHTSSSPATVRAGADASNRIRSVDRGVSLRAFSVNFSPDSVAHFPLPDAEQRSDFGALFHCMCKSPLHPGLSLISTGN